MSDRQAGDHFDALKEFLNTEYPEYEVVFSEIYHSNEVAVLAQNVISTHLGGGKPLLGSTSGLERRCFSRVRHARDGWLIHRADTLAEIQQRDTLQLGSRAEGIVSNTFWSLHRSLLAFDETKLQEMSARLGNDWAATRAYVTAHKALSLGVLARKGSVTWAGTNFTAVAAPLAEVPFRLRNKLCISGFITFSNSLPAAIVYVVGSNHFKVELGYERTSITERSLPSHIGYIQEVPKYGWMHLLTVELIAFHSAKFPPNSTGPAEFQQFNGKLTLLNKISNGKAFITGVKGRLVNPVPVGIADSGSGSLAKRRAVLRWIIVPTLLLAPSVFLGRKLLNRVFRRVLRRTE